MQLSSAGSTDISRQKFADVQERSLETRVRRRNRGLSRRNEDYDVRILPKARHYYGLGSTFPQSRSSKRRRRRGRSRFTIRRSNEAVFMIKFLARSRACGYV